MIDTLNYCYPDEPYEFTEQDAKVFNSYGPDDEGEVDIISLANKTSPCDDHYQSILDVFEAHDTSKKGKLNLEQYSNAMAVVRELL